MSLRLCVAAKKALDNFALCYMWSLVEENLQLGPHSNYAYIEERELFNSQWHGRIPSHCPRTHGPFAEIRSRWNSTPRGVIYFSDTLLVLITLII